MAKKKANGNASGTSNTSNNNKQPPHEDPELQAAEEELRRARDALREAEAQYRRIRTAAAQKVEELRETSLGEVVDETLQLVRKYPGAGVITATLVGFFLGRLFRRLW